MPEEFEQSGVEFAGEAGQQEVTTQDTAIETGEQGGSEAGTQKGDPSTAWEKRISSMRQKWEQEVSSKYGDYDTIKQRTSYLDKRARQEGFSDVDSYLQAIDELEQRQQYERESQRMGVDPETYAQYFAPVTQKNSELEQKLWALESQLTERQQQEQAQAQWGELYQQYPGIVEDSRAWEKGENPSFYTEQMQELVNMGYKPVHAYELAHKDTLFHQREQQVLARVTGRDGKQVLSSTDSPNNVQFDPANMSSEQLRAISERVRRGERITFD